VWCLFVQSTQSVVPMQQYLFHRGLVIGDINCSLDLTKGKFVVVPKHHVLEISNCNFTFLADLDVYLLLTKVYFNRRNQHYMSTVLHSNNLCSSQIQSNSRDSTFHAHYWDYILLNLKMKIFKSSILPTALYGCETCKSMIRTQIQSTCKQSSGPRKEEVNKDRGNLHDKSLIISINHLILLE